jgi:hypothetical protein
MLGVGRGCARYDPGHTLARKRRGSPGGQARAPGGSGRFFGATAPETLQAEASDLMSTKTFTATVEARARGGITIKLPFDPSAEWGDKQRHDVTGTIGRRKVRGRLTPIDGAHYLELGPAWCRDSSVAVGARVAVALSPEGPQVASLAPDLAAALEAEPEARRFFESLPTFYRKNFVRWIEESKRPATRAKRIADAVATLKAGKRQH